MAVGLFRSARRRRETTGDGPRPSTGSTGLLDDAFRRAPSTAERVHENGDHTPFVSTPAILRHGGGTVPVLFAASEMAIHILETTNANSGVSSYNRVVRF